MCRRRKLTIRTDIAVIQIIYFVGLYFTQRLISWQTKEEALQKKFLAYNSKKTVNFKATYNIHNKSAAGSLPMEHERAGAVFCCGTLPPSHGVSNNLRFPLSITVVATPWHDLSFSEGMVGVCCSAWCLLIPVQTTFGKIVGNERFIYSCEHQIYKPNIDHFTYSFFLYGSSL